MAEANGVSVRTLRNWMRLDPAEQVARPGRPRTPAAELGRARAQVREVLDQIGWDCGEETVWHALDCSLPRARVRRVLRELKADRRRSARRERERARVSVEVRARDAVWAMDATHLGRDAHGGAVQAEVVRDVACARTIGLWVGPPASGQEVVQILEGLVAERGGAPLVLLTDNGGAYRSGDVARWCAEHGVLQLFILPRTPQQNGACEHGMYPLKLAAGMGRGVRLLDTAAARARLEAARDRIDENRPLRTRGWRTAVEADRSLPHWSTLASREEVLERAPCTLRRMVLDCTTGRARRRAEREAILRALEDFSVITRTRGGRPWTAQDAEDDS